MEKLTINLPSVSQRLRKLTPRRCVLQKTQCSSAERVRRYRQKVKNNPDRLAEVKRKKQIENKKYKEKLKAARNQNKALDDAMKLKQNEWQRKSRQKNKQSKTQTQQKQMQNPSKGKKKQSKAKTQENGKHKLSEKVHQQAKEIKKLKQQNRRSQEQMKRKQSHDKRQSAAANSWITLYRAVSNVGRPTKEQTVIKEAVYAVASAHSSGSPKKMSRFASRKVKQSEPKGSQKNREQWRERIIKFLQENSRVMPNKRDTILMDGKRVAKRHLLCTKRQTFKAFKAENPDYKYKYTTFVKNIPKNIQRLKLNNRRVCICAKDYNVEQKVEALKTFAHKFNKELEVTVKSVSDMSLCPYEGKYPMLSCVERRCGDCGTQSIINNFTQLKEYGDKETVVWYEWAQQTESYKNSKGETKTAKTWKQVKKQENIQNLIKLVAADIQEHSGHMYRATYQQEVESILMNDTLPIDHAVAVMDFSENISLQAQDEIESAHWAQKQVTLHPVYLVRHHEKSTVETPVYTKESIIMISNSLKHDANAVYAFTRELLIYMEHNPKAVPHIKTLHRFSDNCSAQYKCKNAFAHLPLYQPMYGTDVWYHYTEAGHGKGPSDGIGATVKQTLDRLIVGDQVFVKDAYQAYIAINHALHDMAPNDDRPSRKRQLETSSRKILFVPSKKIRMVKPAENTMAKSLVGTQTFHMVRLMSADPPTLVCQSLGCSCKICVNGDTGDCPNAHHYHRKLMHLYTGKVVHTTSATSDNTSAVAVEVDTQDETGDVPMTSNVELSATDDLVEGMYYAVYFDDQYYIGRLLKECPCEKLSENHPKFKFLHISWGEGQNDGVCEFNWPKRVDIDCVDRNFVFWGPLTPEGHGPFTFRDIDNLKRKYKKIKHGR